MKKNLKNTMTALVGLFVVHYIFSVLDLYWIYLWLDNVMHFTAGVIVSLFFINLLDKNKLVSWSLAGSMRRIGMVVFVACVALGWEYIERALGLTKSLDTTLYDTQMDVWATISGSFAGYLYTYIKFRKYERN